MFSALDLEVVSICGTHNLDELISYVNSKMTQSPAFHGFSEVLISPLALVKASSKSGTQNEYDVSEL
jgi:hypothetical protein